MEQESTGLSTEVLQGIKPFSGTPEDISEQSQMMMSGHTLQKVETQYTTAISVQQHRSLARVVANVLEEASLAGEDFYWGWHVRQKQKDGSYKKVWIDGASIGLANCVARNWGNCATDVVPIDENGTHFMLKAFFVDLETGYNGSRLYRQRKKQKIGMKDTDRQEDMVFQIAQSKVIRNVVTNAMPRWLIKQAVQKAQEAVKKGIGESLPLARSNALRYFMGEGASQDRIENAMSRKADEWTPEDIVMLRGMRTAFEEGRVTIDELFPPIAEDTAPEATEPPVAAQEEEPNLTSDHEEFRQEWINLRSAGFATYVQRNIKRIEERFPQSMKEEMRDKWLKLYEEAPWPLSVLAAPLAPPTEHQEGTTEPEATEAPAESTETPVNQMNNILSELGYGGMEKYKAALKAEGVQVFYKATPLQQEAIVKTMQGHLDAKLAQEGE